MTEYPPPFDAPEGRRRGGLPQQSGVPELSGGFPRPGYHRSDDPVDDPELSDVADLVRDVLHEHRMRPAARDLLRAQLMAAASTQVQTQMQGRAQPPTAPTAGSTPTTGSTRTTRTPRTGPTVLRPDTGPTPSDDSPTGAHRIRPVARPSGRPGRRAGAHRPTAPTAPPSGPQTGATGRPRPQRRVPVLGWSAIGAVAALAVALVALRGLPGAQPGVPIRTVVGTLGIVDRVSADPGEGLSIVFSQQMNRASVTAALRLTPDAKVVTSWQGDTMTVSPVHGFAPNVAYVLTIDHTVAKLADNTSPAADVKVTFGTAPTAHAVTTGEPAKLTRTPVTAAEDGSEAMVNRDGSVLISAAQQAPGSKGPAGLVRMNPGAAERLGAATPAISMSRSGRSIAFLTGSGASTQIAFADAAGGTVKEVPAIVDPNTPLGWIGDNEVAFVSGGKLSAVDRNGKARTIMDSRADAGDTVVFAPGGRFAFLAHDKEVGNVVDLSSGPDFHRFPLSRRVGTPTFSADGSTVYWVEAHNKQLHLDCAPSADGPTMSVRIPDIKPGDTISDLSVSPDGTLLAYSVTRTDQQGELRLAALPDLTTLAVSREGVGHSPNWAPNSRMLTVLARGTTGARVQTIDVPSSVTRSVSPAAAVAHAFVNAQISRDTDAQQALAPGMSLPQLPKVTRAAIVYVRPTGPGTASATIRLSIDPAKDNPVVQQATETLQLDVPGGGDVPRVVSATVTKFAPAPMGPQLSRVDTQTVKGAALLTFDSDLNPLAVPGAVAMLSGDGSDVAVTATYDAATRTIRVQPAAARSLGSGAATVLVTTALRDVTGNPLATQVALPVQLGTTGR